METVLVRGYVSTYRAVMAENGALENIKIERNKKENLTEIIILLNEQDIDNYLETSWNYVSYIKEFQKRYYPLLEQEAELTKKLAEYKKMYFMSMATDRKTFRKYLNTKALLTATSNQIERLKNSYGIEF